MYNDGGENVLRGEAGDDMLTSGSGSDLLVGGDGSDTLIGGAGNDTLYAGNDGLIVIPLPKAAATAFAPPMTVDVLSAGHGDDRLEFNDGGIATGAGGAGVDFFEVDAISQTVTISDFLDGGSSMGEIIRLDGAGASDGVTSFGDLLMHTMGDTVYLPGADLTLVLTGVDIAADTTAANWEFFDLI